jgi:hypothetical protein
MDLWTRHSHKAGKSIMVNGNVYPIGDDCIVRDVKAEDAEKLLGNASWMNAEDKPANPADTRTARREAFKASQAAERGEDATRPGIESQVMAAEERKLATEPETEPEAEPSADEMPDPSEDLPIEKLREMCDAYEVKYTAKTGKKTLVKRLEEAMYE